MEIIKILFLIFLALYFLDIGLVGLGANLTFLTPHVTAFFALATGILAVCKLANHFWCSSCEKR